MDENPFRSDPEIESANQPNRQHKDYWAHAIQLVLAVLLGLMCVGFAVTSETIAGTLVSVCLALFMFAAAVRHYQLYRRGLQQYRANHLYWDGEKR